MQRILKVREAQRKLKERALQAAGNHWATLEQSAIRIKLLYAETLSHSEAEDVDTLSAKMELANRLVDAEQKMEVSIETARQDFAHAERQNFAARATYDGAEKVLNSKVKKARRAREFRTQIDHNILYNMDNKRKKDRRNDWQNHV